MTIWNRLKPREYVIFRNLAGLLLLVMAISGSAQDKTKFVDVFIGTGGHGHTFPGAVLPHGMVQLSPDTRLDGWDACGGYHYSDHTLMGFSHTHLNGTGIGDLGDVVFMPMTREEKLNSLARSTFSHDQETARPGYYQVMLLDDQINAELTATKRTGMHRYTYPDRQNARLLIDLSTTIHSRRHPVEQIWIVNDHTVAGMKYSEGWAPQRVIYFYAEFSQPFTASLYNRKGLLKGQRRVTDETVKALLHFRRLSTERQVIAKVGLSAVDAEGAKRNLHAENPGWDFDHVAGLAQDEWNKQLGRIEVETSAIDQKKIFYTAFYHAMIQPCIFSDVDGRYRTMSMSVAQDKDYTNYTIFSLWDTFRAVHPFYTIIAPTFDEALIRSLLRKYDEQGILPRWELHSAETGCMIGYHAVSIIADAMMKGLQDFDQAKALEACIRSSVFDTVNVSMFMDPDVLHSRMSSRSLQFKNVQGFIPCDQFTGSVSKGLEEAYNDWLIAQMAKRSGRMDVYQQYIRWGQNYKNYFDAKTKFMRPRLSNGAWKVPYRPTDVNRRNDYVEGNGWQWTWFVPHDIEGLIRLMGGKKAFEKKLDALFHVSSQITGDGTAADVTGMIGQYAHGNEPSQHIPYIYNLIGKPRKTQEIVDSLLYGQYRVSPDGLCGNEDVGQMSAWYLLSSMGFYSFCPGVPVYETGRPVFDRVTIHLENGRLFVIKAINNSRKNKYVSKLTLNGKVLDHYRFTHQDLMDGGELVFYMQGK
ncbi:MAG: GH92 family glycosyl hydrolase [Prevotella sp.]|nr:GH92 family glycosyl hydrolase [Prevotella sp.]